VWARPGPPCPRAVVHREVPALLAAAPHPGVPGGLGPLVVAPAEALARMLRCQEPTAAIVADRQRDRTLQAQGFVALRFPSDEVLRDPAGLVACVRAVLARG
jgi:hypothetical protein